MHRARIRAAMWAGQGEGGTSAGSAFYSSASHGFRGFVADRLPSAGFLMIEHESSLASGFEESRGHHVE